MKTADVSRLIDISGLVSGKIHGIMASCEILAEVNPFWLK
jgi:hypothetical protein